MSAQPEEADPWLTAWADSLDTAADAWQREVDELIDRLQLRGGHVVLDAGCGSGRIMGWLADRVGPRGRVVGVDREPAALEVAGDRLAGRADVTQLWVGDVERLPFDADTFDAAWCSRVVSWVENPRHALAELVRVVRPGGRVAVLASDAARATFLPIDPGLESAIRRAHHRAHAAGAWGEPYHPHVGRRLYELASSLPVAGVEPATVTWERVAPLTPIERRYLHAILAWLADPASRRWLGRDWGQCRRLFHPDSESCIVDRPDLHVVQSATAVIITV